MARTITTLLLALIACALLAAGEDREAPRWIAVVAPTFREAIAPLCERRRDEGMRVHVVEATDAAGALADRVHDLCRGAKGPCYVLLVGAARAAGPAAVPPLRGTNGRMAGQPSDNGYGCLDAEPMPSLAVGRFPARTEEEARSMVGKTIAFERDPSGPWRDRLTLLVGNPGGTTPAEKRFAEWFIQGAAGARFERIRPRWTVRAVVHAAGSPFCVPDDRLRDVSLRYIEEGQFFSLYLGHSGPSGLWSDGARFVDREDWARLKIPSGAGPFFTCGCYACQLAPDGAEGYGLEAMRNPGGPAAVIGSHGESYAAMGQLALDGMLGCLGAAEPPVRLADFWLAAKAGLARGKMDALTFWLYDQADGSRGKVSLDRQRLEHLEMWMLLGDPALRLPAAPPRIELTAAGAPSPGKAIVVSGSIPAAFAGAAIRLTLERPLGSTPANLQTLPADPARSREAMMANHERANEVVIESREVRPRQDGKFECALDLPERIAWPRVIVRAVAAGKEDRAMGFLELSPGK